MSRSIVWGLFLTFLPLVGCSDDVHLLRNGGIPSSNFSASNWVGCRSGISVHDSSHHPDSHAESEHELSLKLFTENQATHTSIRSGAWNDPGVWGNGTTPIKDAWVWIREEHEISIAGEAKAHRIRVDGTLMFAANEKSELQVETIVVYPSGNFLAGTPDKPILSEASVRIKFSDTGPLNPIEDPIQLARGLISHGNVCLYGMAKTPFVQLTDPVLSGGTFLRAVEPPKGWRAGDRIVLPSTQEKLGNQDETVTVINIVGTTVQISPPRYDHGVSAHELPYHVANLSRNVTFESENKSILSRRGHVIFLHTNRVGAYFVEFNGLGRTNKLLPVDDPVHGSGTNPRGRYSFHIHGGGTAHDSIPAVIHGTVVEDNPGWGYVNHSGHVELTDNIAYNVGGAAFVTEAGDETGLFDHNFAIRTHGSGESVSARSSIQDYGHEGVGYWFQGMAGIRVTRNIAAGHPIGFFIYNEGLLPEGEERRTGMNAFGEQDKCVNCIRIKTENLQNPLWGGGAETVNITSMPIRKFEDNLAYQSEYGLKTRYLQSNANRDPSLKSYIDGFQTWNVVTGAHLAYSTNFEVRNCKLIAAPDGDEGRIGIHIPVESGENFVLQNARVENFNTGIAFSPEPGTQIVDGGYFENQINFYIVRARRLGRTIDFRGAVELPRRETTYDYYLDPTIETDRSIVNIDRILVDSGLFRGKQLYFAHPGVPWRPFQDTSVFGWIGDRQ